MMIKKIRLQDIFIFIYMISVFAMVATEESWMKLAGIKTKYIISIVFILVAVVLFLLSKRTKIKKKLMYYFCFSMMPYIIIFCFEIFNYLIKDNYNYQESLKYIVYWIVPIFLAFFALQVFGKKAIDYTFYPMAAAYIITIVYSIYVNGFSSHIYIFKSASNAGNILESHALIFTFGLFWIYYVLFEKKSKIKVLLLSLFMVLGFKRIEIIAIILTLILYKFFIKRFMNQNNAKKYITIMGIGILMFCIGYIYIIQSGALSIFVNKYNINTMSRLGAYEYFSNDYSLSITYFGKGVGYVTSALSQVGSILRNIGELHNDILKNYIEFGFIGFILYFSNFIIWQSVRIAKKIKYQSALVYLILTIFSVIIYATDNVSRYLVYQLVFIIIPYAHYCKILEEEKIGENNDRE